MKSIIDLPSWLNIILIRLFNVFFYVLEIMDEGVKFMALLKTPFYAWFAGALVLIIDHPDDVHTVLTSKTCMEKAAIYKFFNMGSSLFTAPGYFCENI